MPEILSVYFLRKLTSVGFTNNSENGKAIVSTGRLTMQCFGVCDRFHMLVKFVHRKNMLLSLLLCH